MSTDIPVNSIQCDKPFFIAFIGRSGSTHFHHLLNQHPDIKCYKEMFNPVAFWGLKGKRWKHHVKKLIGRKNLTRARLFQIYGLATPKSRGFTYKIAKDFETFPEVHAWLKSHAPNMKCIFLERKNDLRGAISLQNFKKVKKIYKANLDDGFKGKIESLDLDINWAIDETKWRKEMNEKYFASLSKEFPIHKVYYEDLLSNELNTLNECFEFLDLPQINTPDSFVHKTRQISEKNICDYITNYKELEKRIKIEGMEHYLTS